MQCCTIASLYFSEVVKRMRSKISLWERQGRKKMEDYKLNDVYTGNWKRKGGFLEKGISIAGL